MAEGVVWFVVDEIRLRLRATLIRFDADGDPVARVVRTPECVIPDTAADISARMSETRRQPEIISFVAFEFVPSSLGVRVGMEPVL